MIKTVYTIFRDNQCQKLIYQFFKIFGYVLVTDNIYIIVQSEILKQSAHVSA